jgi:hypothetical protein
MLTSDFDHVSATLNFFLPQLRLPETSKTADQISASLPEIRSVWNSQGQKFNGVTIGGSQLRGDRIHFALDTTTTRSAADTTKTVAATDRGKKSVVTTATAETTKKMIWIPDKIGGTIRIFSFHHTPMII